MITYTQRLGIDCFLSAAARLSRDCDDTFAEGLQELCDALRGQLDADDKERNAEYHARVKADKRKHLRAIAGGKR